MAVNDAPYSVDRPAVKNQLDAFWGPNGWRVGADGLTSLPMKALQAGILFREPRRLDHAGWIAAAHAVRDRVGLEDVATAFVASLGTDRRDLRSAIASWVLLRHLPRHDPDPWEAWCGLCGLPLEGDETDLNTMSFERFQWAGVRHDDVQYATFDLEMFLRAPLAPVTSEALEAGRSLITLLRTAQAGATVASLARSTGVPEGNAARRRVVLEILGVCGILASPEHPGFWSTFVPYRDRQDRPTGRTDVAYPSCWWRGEYGIDESVASEALPLITGDAP